MCSVGISQHSALRDVWSKEEWGYRGMDKIPYRGAWQFIATASALMNYFFHVFQLTAAQTMNIFQYLVWLLAHVIGPFLGLYFCKSCDPVVWALGEHMHLKPQRLWLQFILFTLFPLLFWLGGTRCIHGRTRNAGEVLVTKPKVENISAYA